MRYGIFSDVHSNLEALDEVLDKYKKEAIDIYLFVGDVVGYGANPAECIQKVKDIAMVSIAGNHDWACVDLFSPDYFNSQAKSAISWTRQGLDYPGRHFLESLKLIYGNEDLTLVHGTLNDPQDFNYMISSWQAQETFGLLKTDVCFIGHLHVAGYFRKDKDERIYYDDCINECAIDIQGGNRYIVNVGSVGQPRDGNPDASYCIYDTDEKKVYIKRVAYDIQTAGRKIINAGLPRFLAERLISGH